MRTGRVLVATLHVALAATVSAPAAAQAPFSAAVTPQPIVLQAGGSAVSVSVTTTTHTAMREPIEYSFSGFPAGITITGAATVAAPYAPASFTFTAAQGTAAGTYQGMLTGTTSAATVTAAVALIVRPPPPVVHSVTPSALAAGTRDAVVRIAGEHFQPGATVASPDPALRIVGARVLSPTLAEATVAVAAHASGAFRLHVVNPDGASAAAGVMLRVHAASALASPLGVRAIRIVAPRRWQVVGADEPLHAQALVAVSGMGTITGTWLLDGVPFERFTRIVSAGAPLEIRSTLPIPSSYTGEHRLELQLDAPHGTVTESVAFMQAAETPATLRVLAPADGDGARPASILRWSIVPGAAGYEVELRYRARDAGGTAPWRTVRRRVTETEWRPEPAVLDALQDRDASFRVRAVYPGGVFGAPTPWREIRTTPPAPPPQDDAPPGVDGAPPGAGAARTELRAASHEGESPGDAATAENRAAAAARLARGERPAAASEEQQDERRVDLGVGSITTATGSNAAGPPAQTRLQLSTLLDVRHGAHRHQLAGDASVSHDLGEPWDARADNRHWVGRFGLAHDAWQPALTIGYAPPFFLDQAELLPVFGADGGVQGSIESPAGRASYYQTLRLAPSGTAPHADPRIAAGAYELFTADRRFVVRATTLHVSEPADVEPDDEAPARGATGSAFGILASADFGARLHLVAEAASGDYRPGEDSGDPARSGTAVRLAASGSAGALTYVAGVSRTEADFVNPANPGFTPAGISGRTRAHVSLSRALGGATVAGELTHTRGGIAESVGDPRTTENGARLTLAVPLTSSVSFTAGANAQGQRGRAVEELELPGTDRSGHGVELGAQAAVGRFALTPSFGWQQFTDRHDSWADQTLRSMALAAHGTLHRALSVAANVSETLLEASPDLGTTRHHLLSIQPVLTVLDGRFRLNPRAAYSRATNDVHESDSRSLTLQLGARYAAPWRTVPLALEVSSDWSRTDAPTATGWSAFQRRTRLTLSLDWRADRLW